MKDREACCAAVYGVAKSQHNLVTEQQIQQIVSQLPGDTTNTNPSVPSCMFIFFNQARQSPVESD